MNDCHDPKTGQFCSKSGARAARKWRGGATRQAAKLLKHNRMLSAHQEKYGPSKTAQKAQARNADKIRSLVNTYGVKV